MTATEILREEHRVILRALELLDHARERLSAGRSLPEGWWDDLIEWLRAFADRAHHGKEERFLFPALGQAGVPCEGGPIAVMLTEHEEGRALIYGMQAADGPDRAAAAQRYLSLLRNHIDKENGVLFPLAEVVLDDAAQDALTRQFENVGSDQGSEPSIQQAEIVLDRLSARLA